MNKWGLERFVNALKISCYLMVDLRFQPRQTDFGDVYFRYNLVINERWVVTVSDRTYTQPDDIVG